MYSGVYVSCTMISAVCVIQAEGFPEEYTRPLFIDLSSSNSTTNTITITFPPNVVSGSQLIKVTLAGITQFMSHLGRIEV